MEPRRENRKEGKKKTDREPRKDNIVTKERR